MRWNVLRMEASVREGLPAAEVAARHWEDAGPCLPHHCNGTSNCCVPNRETVSHRRCLGGTPQCTVRPMLAVQ